MSNVFFRVFGFLSTRLTGATAGGWKPTHRIITRRRAGIFLTTETELSYSLNLVTRLNKTVYDLIYLLLNLQAEMNTHPPALLDCFLFSHAHDFIHNTSTAVSAHGCCRLQLVMSVVCSYIKPGWWHLQKIKRIRAHPGFAPDFGGLPVRTCLSSAPNPTAVFTCGAAGIRWPWHDGNYFANFPEWLFFHFHLPAPTKLTINNK